MPAAVDVVSDVGQHVLQVRPAAVQFSTSQRLRYGVSARRERLVGQCGRGAAGCFCERRMGRPLFALGRRATSAPGSPSPWSRTWTVMGKLPRLVQSHIEAQVCRRLRAGRRRRAQVRRGRLRHGGQRAEVGRTAVAVCRVSGSLWRLTSAFETENRRRRTSPDWRLHRAYPFTFGLISAWIGYKEMPGYKRSPAFAVSIGIGLVGGALIAAARGTVLAGRSGNR